MTNSRQLAAIMFTDIQGYTRLMQQNEAKAIQSREKHRRIFNASTDKFQGRILQYYGDGTLSIFNSAIDAVNCAIEMQLGFQEDPAIPVRIGIHTGDIIFSDEEIIGDGVNIASRIESLAVAGSVLLSDKVFDEIKNQQAIKTSFLKTVKLKNVEKPVDIYAISNVGLIVPKIGDISSTSSENEEKSIAVLPFVNMSNDPEQEYFSDGISEEILNSLTNVDGLKVAGRTSAFTFKGKNEDIRIIGEKLNVKMVLEGSVRKAENRLRITAQLINVKDGFHLWSESYNREMEDIFAVQEDIANRIVEKFKLQVQETHKSQTKNMKAYDLILKGKQLLRKDLAESKQAMECFQEAAKLDPNYAEAYACIAETYLNLAGYNEMSSADAYSKARTAARKAISLNKYEPHAHEVLAYIHLYYEWDWEATHSEYNKAIQYGLPEQNKFMAYYYIFVRADYDRAIQLSKQLLEADPLHAESHWHLGLCNYFAARFEEALVAFNKALDFDPYYSNVYMWRGTVLAYLKMYEEAIDSIDKSLELTNGEGIANIEKIAVQILTGKKEQALENIKSQDFIDPMDAARLYTLLEMPNEAVAWLERGYRERSLMMITLKNWIWDPLRNDPRFIKIYNQMNFPA